MAQGPHQFTPSQILEAGRRAEAEGRIEYAIQFYRHLTDHLARTAEATAAREALARLGASPQPTTGHSPVTPATFTPQATVNGHAYNGAVMNGNPAAGSNPTGYGPQAAGAAHPQGPHTRPQTALVPHPNATGAGARNPAATDPAARRRFVLPKSRRRYRTGRFVARVVTVLGFVQIALGAALLVLGGLARFGIGGQVLPEMIAAQQQLIGTTAGVSFTMLGLMLVLAGQLARAMFDTASANRDLAAFARARAAFDAGHADDQSAAD